MRPVFYHFASGVGNSAAKTPLPSRATAPVGDSQPSFAKVLGGRLAGSRNPAPPQRLSPHSPLVLASQLWGGVPTLRRAPLPGSRQISAGRPAPHRTPRTPWPQKRPGQQRPEAKPLGQAMSTYDGGRFHMRVGRSRPERVGRGIEQFHFPHLVEKDGLYYAYFIDHTGGSENDVGLAISSDGVNFEYQGKVLTKGAEFDDAQASFPGVAYDGETKTWYMLYEGKRAGDDQNSVCLATSQDGRHWEKQGPIIRPGDAGPVSNIDVGTPTLFKENGVWHVYFHTFADDGRVRIGYASGKSLTDLTVKQGPLLDTDASGLEAGTVGARSNVIKVGDYYYMAYETCEAYTDFGQARWGTNLARAKSPEGPWEKMDGPLLKNKGIGFGADGPELLVQDGKIYLYYRYGGNNTARVELTGLEGQGQPLMAHQAA